MKNFNKLFISLMAFLPLFLISSCKTSQFDEPNPEFALYVNSYTGGMISDKSSIKINLVTPVNNYQNMQEEISDIFSFSPNISGTAQWTSSTTIEFFPVNLNSGETYKASFRLSNLYDIKDKELETFKFSFTVLPKELALTLDNVKITEQKPDIAEVSGKIIFSEEVSPDAVKSMLSIKYPGNVKTENTVSITPDNNLKSFSYRIYPLPIEDGDSKLEIVADGSKEGFKKIGKKEIILPGQENFRVISTKSFGGDDPYIRVTFSQPIATDLDLKGLVETNLIGDFYETEDNVIKIFYREKKEETIKISISQYVRSSLNKRLEDTYTEEIKNELYKPQVIIPLNGSILPSSGELILPFKAVNLAAVDISIIKIYENNVMMFLQENNLSGSNALRRSGRLVYKNTVRLDNSPEKDLHEWNDFSIDLSNLFKQEPGAIYRIKLSFNQDYSLYDRDNANITSVAVVTEKDKNVWDETYPYYYDDGNYDWRVYKWEDRDNPKTPTYYMENSRFPECNLMTADLGIIVKSASKNKVWVAVNNIISSQPVSKANVTVYNYQLQEIGRSITDKNGFAEIKLEEKAFIITASDGNTTSYLKVNDGNENSLSRFDTGGKILENGIKGYIYGERGVWRPGDTLHLALMVDAGNEVIPENHPVIFELYTPQGQFYHKQVNTESANSLYVFNIPTTPDVPTGIWNSYFKIGGATFHKALHIETIKPNRLKINLDISDKILSSSNNTRIDIASSWLTGPAAANMDASIEMTLTKSKTAFPDYKKFIFEDGGYQFSSIEQTLFTGKLDNNGTASKYIQIPRNNNASGMLKATLFCRVTEPGGEFSIVSKTLPYSPFEYYAGVKLPESDNGYLETDKDHNIEFVSVNERGKAVSGRKLEYRIYKIDWSWWWENNNSTLDSYINSSSSKLVTSGTLTSGSKPVSVNFRIDYPEWGRYLVYVRDVKSGHVAGGTFNIDWPSWRGRSDKNDPDALTMLTFTTDKTSYKTGEEATIFIPAAKDGRALVSFENGSGVLSARWVNTDAEKDTPYKFTITEEMAPNFYAHITLIQPHERTDNDLPIRLYGVRPIMVDNEDARLLPEITAPSVIRPQEEFTVKVKEEKGRSMNYTLAIVDEGLLSLTSFRTPDPYNEFYSREALGVKTWDLYDEIIGAFSGRFSPMFSVGGDDYVEGAKNRDNKFEPMVRFYGPFTLKKGRTDEHKITLPTYIGSVRIMVVASGNETSGKKSYGNASKEVPVRSPLMLLSSAPETIGIDESLCIPVNVFSLGEGIKDVKVRMTLDGDAATISGNNEKDVYFASEGDKIVRFDLKTADKQGKIKLAIEAEGTDASGKKHKAAEYLEINVKNPNPPVIETSSGILEPGENRKFSYQPFPEIEDNWAKLIVSSFPTINADACFEYLKYSNYYCTGQNIMRGLILLHINDFLDEKEQEAVKELIPEILKELYTRQLPDGGFSYWNDNYANEWITSMAGQLFTDAKAEGYTVNEGVYNKWKRFQKNCVRNYRPNSKVYLGDLTQAYRLYTLALASAPELGSMNRMKEGDTLSNQARWRLAAAYAVSGKKEIANSLIKGVGIGYSGTSTRDLAMYLETMILVDDLSGANEIAGKISSIFSDHYFIMEETAFAAIAMDRLADKANTGTLEAELKVDGGETENIKKATATYVKELEADGNCVEITNRSEKAIYCSLITSRISENVEASSEKITIKVDYLNADGNVISPYSMKQGDDIYMRVAVTNSGNPSDYNDVALTITAPSGWEIFNERLYDENDGGTFHHEKDVRDNRIIYYFDATNNTRFTFTDRFRIVYEGSFILPAVKCESLTDPSVHANTASARISVTR